ncbi:uncharacterized protein K02A2.6-like isoform X2 [Rhipicephalus sanguineus]|uniref:uncharacterized protein K02A2.6-like isoform X2 n=1 Tax=Rhipicephalus sanguineus TaxID=34632 RepID=UPI0018961F88|nr:uncharacterized protein K02A2.6-like isoform X2 [Rhipicephalus sanguineus]
MEHLRPPEPLRLTADGGRNWKRFRQQFEFFLQATACKSNPRSEAAKTALLLSVAGDEALDVFNNFVFSGEENKEDFNTVIAKFEDYCLEQQNEIHERYVFRSRSQGEAEPFELFLRELKKQAQHCNFGTMADDMVRDQVVFGTNSPRLREKMLRDKSLTLEKVIVLCKAAETSARQNEFWQKGKEELDMNAVTASRSTPRGSRNDLRCTRCNRRHAVRRCPAYGKVCYSCNGRNHFASCCSEKERVDEVQHQSDDFEVLNVASSSASRERDWRVNACIDGKYVTFKVDTGSQANVLPLSMFRKLKMTTLMPSSAVLRSYGGNMIKHIGKFSALIEIGDRKACAEFFVVKKDHSTILGLDTSEKLGIVRRAVDSVTTNDTEEITKEFPRLFHGTGCAPREYKIELHRDAVPVVQPARRVPLSLREPLRTELDRMEKEGIIQKVSSPTDWMALADMLSRSPVPGLKAAACTSDVEIHAVTVVSALGESC